MTSKFESIMRLAKHTNFSELNEKSYLDLLKLLYEAWEDDMVLYENAIREVHLRNAQESIPKDFDPDRRIVVR